MTAATWRALTRPELKTFDKVAQDVILEAMDRGGVGRISTKGHCIIRVPGGGTMSVSRNTNAGNRSAENTRADFRRLFGDAPAPAPAINGTSTPVDTSLEPELDHLNPTIDCPLDGCDAVFVTEGARYSHVQKVHFPCPEPGCDYIGKSNQALGPHVRIRHGGHKPWEIRSEKAAMAKKSDHMLLETIRELVGATDDTERVQALEKELKVAEKKITELEGKLTKLREALA